MSKHPWKILNLFLIIALTGINPSFGQSPDFTGYRIFINPGHGGHDSDDRHMTTDFWESDGNLVKGLFLRELMINMKAQAFISRTTNTTADDLPLSTISAMANASNVDFFLSIHSNGYDGTQNQPLMLYRGYDEQPVYPESKVIAQVLWQKVFERGNCWTSSSPYVKGDWTFYPDWGTQGLGVLRGLTMPGVLSEGSFHDYIPESWRLRNNDFLHHEAWAFVRALTSHENVTPVSFGIIAGIVRDSLKVPAWYFKPGTRDATLPVNKVKVRLTPGNRIYRVDSLNNGFFMFDSVAPGPYRLIFDRLGNYLKDSLDVNVLANKTTFGDIWLKFDTATIPAVKKVTPVTIDSVAFNQEFAIEFTLPMNRVAVQNALSLNPAVQISYSWNELNTIVIIKPLVRYLPKTAYTVTVAGTACSKWKVGLASPYSFSFNTKNRTKLSLEKSFPQNGKSGISIYPQVRLMFDAPLDQSLVSSSIRFLNDQDQEVEKIRASYSEADGKGTYLFEPANALPLNKTFRIVLDRDLADIGGSKLGETKVITFKTRMKPYITGQVIETFDDISDFWDPEASGSTTGTDNPLTTFTSSAIIKRGGSTSGRLEYVFVNNSGGVCRTFDTQKPAFTDDPSKEFGMWVFGDLSYNILEYWFYSSGSTNQIVFADTIDWAGWEFKSIPVTSIGGTGSLSFHSTVIIQTPGGAKKGTIYFDEAQLVYPTAIHETPEPDETNLAVYPSPFAERAKISFTLKERSEITLDILSLAGEPVERLADQEMDPGSQEFDWVPRSSLPNGMYLCRLQVRKSGLPVPRVYIKRCVLMR